MAFALCALRVSAVRPWAIGGDCRGSGRRFGRIGQAGNDDAEHGAAGGTGGDLDAAVVQADDVIHNGQAQPHPLAAGAGDAHEALEDAVHEFGRDAAAAVGHGEHGGAGELAGHADADAAARRGVADGVVHQVGRHLPQQLHVAMDEHARGQALLQQDALVLGQRVELGRHGFHRAGQVEGREMLADVVAVQVGQGQQALHHLGQAGGILEHAGDGRPKHFTLESWRVIVDQNADGDVTSEAIVKVHANNERIVANGEGNGPVNALDNALRAAVNQLYPEIANIELTDYKVRILEGVHGTDAVTRVLVSSTNGHEDWTTIGVHENVIAASWMALEDAVTFGLLKAGRTEGLK